MESYGPEGGYRKGMDMQEKYNCWAATQYREKVSWSFGKGGLKLII
jgi:ADP-ribosylation factor GTPase-activating protein 1